MKKTPLIPIIFFLIITGSLLPACKKDVVHILNLGNFSDTTGTLKDAAAAAGIHFGMAIDYSDFTGNATYASIVKANCDQVTFENEMKGQYLLQNDGSVNFTQADALLNAVTNAGLKVYGHTLIWYQQQNATYLNSIVGGSGGGVSNLLTNGGFESWTGSTPTGWAYYNQVNGNFSQGTGGANVHGGNYSLAVNVTAGAAQNYQLQVASPSFPVVQGHVYLVSFWIMSPVGGSQYQVEGRSPNGSVAYSGNQSTPSTWTLKTFSFTAASSGNGMITFDMGASPNGTTYIDDVSVIDQTAAQQNSTPTAIAHRLDSVMQRYITTVVGHYAGKVVAWDVVNELFTDNGQIRNNTNTPNSNGNPNFFVWSNYLGDSLAIKAFQYARAADPNALLFINDYNLESSPAKLDSLIAYVNRLKSAGVPIDGIGTQMHIAWNTSPAAIDNMFQQLAATGLKIRISELDVKINPYAKPNIAATPLDEYFAYQAVAYQYVVQSYLKNVPKAQQYGITVWGVHDPDSWLYNNGNDFPLLFDSNYKKKPAFAAVLQALKANGQ
ncbi:endo-1,4-beta-xylanase [Thermoflavifilum aggregans]|nr:endo-1,4-beta-xylanase [Thermoflavifilum aggregans]